MDREASAREIRRARNRQLRLCHPDIPKHSPRAAAEAEELTRLINEAGAVLLDAARRRAYDAELDAPVALDPAATPASDVAAAVRAYAAAARSPAPSPPPEVAPPASALRTRLVLAVGAAAAVALVAALLHRPAARPAAAAVLPSLPPAPSVLALGKGSGAGRAFGVAAARDLGWADTGIVVRGGQTVRATNSPGHADARWSLRLNGRVYACVHDDDSPGCRSRIAYTGPDTSLFILATSPEADLSVTVGATVAEPAAATSPPPAPTPRAPAPTPAASVQAVDTWKSFGNGAAYVLPAASTLSLTLRGDLDLTADSGFVADVTAAALPLPPGTTVTGAAALAADGGALDLRYSTLTIPGHAPLPLDALTIGVRDPTGRARVDGAGRLFLAPGAELVNFSAGAILRVRLRVPLDLPRD